MPLALQAKVLRLLQEQRFERLGGNETVQAGIRPIPATNKDLEAEVDQGNFRKDLLYRLNVFTIRLPPLRERRGDIAALIDHFLRRFGPLPGRTIRTIAPDARRCLEEYSWPGNVRELQSVLKYAVIQARGDILTLDSLPENLRRRSSTAVPREEGLNVTALTAALLRSGEPDIYRRVCQEVDRVF